MWDLSEWPGDMTRRGDRGRLSGKAAFVTGAGSGIGRAITLRLAEEGARVVATSRRAAAVAKVCEEVGAASGTTPLGFELDVVDEDAVARVARDAHQEVGPIDVLVSNAGIELITEPSIHDTSSADWHRVLEVNLTGAFNVVRACWPFFADSASVVTIGSVNSSRHGKERARTSRRRAASFSSRRALALELAPRRGRANCLCPGNIDTPLTDAFIASASKPEELRAAYAAEAPLGRLGTAREVADCVLFLASDESTFVTGTALVVDGGMSIRS